MPPRHPGLALWPASVLAGPARSRLSPPHQPRARAAPASRSGPHGAWWACPLPATGPAPATRPRRPGLALWPARGLVGLPVPGYRPRTSHAPAPPRPRDQARTGPGGPARPRLSAPHQPRARAAPASRSGPHRAWWACPLPATGPAPATRPRRPGLAFKPAPGLVGLPVPGYGARTSHVRAPPPRHRPLEFRPPPALLAATKPRPARAPCAPARTLPRVRPASCHGARVRPRRVGLHPPQTGEPHPGRRPLLVRPLAHTLLTARASPALSPPDLRSLRSPLAHAPPDSRRPHAWSVAFGPLLAEPSASASCPAHRMRARPAPAAPVDTSPAGPLLAHCARTRPPRAPPRPSRRPRTHGVPPPAPTCPTHRQPAASLRPSPACSLSACLSPARCVRAPPGAGALSSPGPHRARPPSQAPGPAPGPPSAAPAPHPSPSPYPRPHSAPRIPRPRSTPWPVLRTRY